MPTIANNEPRTTNREPVITTGSGSPTPAWGRFDPVHPLVALVGFDGSEPARHALAAASRLLSTRKGEIRVVFVAHYDLSAGVVPTAPELDWQLFDEESDWLRGEAAAQLGSGQKWSFEYRYGAVARELITAAQEAANRRDHPQVVIVVGSPGHRIHHIAGSVPSALVRHAGFAVIAAP
ncbi:MAG TPA: universal stress protein [Candidatus Dormibacteraeota bacterium]|nr:universal stress protein [Candidatus Dormibacteraeota bacterium]